MTAKSKAIETVEEIKAPEEAAARARTEAESVYSAEELISSHRAFGVPREIAAVALRLAGKEQASFTEARSIIDRFKNKEVKR